MRYRFSGDVQGVGFRFRAYHAAQQLGLTGFVRNEYDGDVEMEVQGERAAVDAMLGMIDQGYAIRVDHIDSRSLPLDEAELSFEIRD